VRGWPSQVKDKTRGSIKGGGQDLKYLAETQDPLA